MTPSKDYQINGKIAENLIFSYFDSLSNNEIFTHKAIVGAYEYMILNNQQRTITWCYMKRQKYIRVKHIFKFDL